MYKDLRDFVESVEQLGALRRIDRADPQFEIGAITEVAAGRPGGPALLFDDIKGFPRGFRILSNAVTNPPRAALALGLDPSMRPLDALKARLGRRLRDPLLCYDRAVLRPRLLRPLPGKLARIAQKAQLLIGVSVHSSAAPDFLAPMARSKRSVVARSAPMRFSSWPTERNPRVARGSLSIWRRARFCCHSAIAFQSMCSLRLK
jgi:hypothetical protein